MKLFQLAVLAAISGVPGWTGPITYNITFTLDPGSFVRFGGVPTQPVSGSFVYDSATTTFSSFHVDFNNRIWDLTQSANSPSGFGQCAGMPDTAASAFLLLQQSLPCSPVYRWGGSTGSQGNNFALQAFFPNPPTGAISINPLTPGFPIAGPGSQDTGGFTISEAPEPTAWMSCLLGLGGLSLYRTLRASQFMQPSGWLQYRFGRKES